jgi:hypothetical protein
MSSCPIEPLTREEKGTRPRQISHFLADPSPRNPNPRAASRPAALRIGWFWLSELISFAAR